MELCRECQLTAKRTSFHKRKIKNDLKLITGFMQELGAVKLYCIEYSTAKAQNCKSGNGLQKREKTKNSVLCGPFIHNDV